MAALPHVSREEGRDTSVAWVRPKKATRMNIQLVSCVPQSYAVSNEGQTRTMEPESRIDLPSILNKWGRIKCQGDAGPALRVSR